MVTSVLQTSMCEISNAWKFNWIQLSNSHIQILYWLKYLLDQTIVWLELYIQIFVILLPICFPEFLLSYTPEILTILSGLMPFCPFHIKSNVISVSLKYLHFLKLNFTVWCDSVDPYAMNKIAMFKVKITYISLLIAWGWVFVLVEE